MVILLSFFGLEAQTGGKLSSIAFEFGTTPGLGPGPSPCPGPEIQRHSSPGISVIFYNKNPATHIYIYIYIYIICDRGLYVLYYVLVFPLRFFKKKRVLCRVARPLYFVYFPEY